MIEQRGQTPTEVEIIRNEFQLHLKSVEFGSADYLAFCDFYALEEQRHNCMIEFEQIKKTLPVHDRVMKESQLRITETRIALLENEIDHRKITDIGYSKAYTRVEKVMEELRTAIMGKLRNEYTEPEDEERINRESRETYHDMLVTEFRDALYRFYG
jgi:hypothetical protein